MVFIVYFSILQSESVICFKKQRGREWSGPRPLCGTFCLADIQYLSSELHTVAWNARAVPLWHPVPYQAPTVFVRKILIRIYRVVIFFLKVCLLYTSDAADDWLVV